MLALPARTLAEAFPEKLLFPPLMADPRWPRFSGTMTKIHKGEQSLLWGANFGESFPWAGNESWQIGAQMGVFSLWDVTTESDDMINADFLVGLPYTRRWGKTTAMFRLFHVSTHLGDEYVIHHPWVNRVNLSYEAIDVRASYDLDYGFRVYGGGGYLYRRYPDDLKPGVLQAGGEWQKSHPIRYGITPYAGVDLQKRQDNGWGTTDVSVRAGVYFNHARLKQRRFSVYADYYRGHNPNGQWFRQLYETSGLGCQFTF